MTPHYRMRMLLLCAVLLVAACAKQSVNGDYDAPAGGEHDSFAEGAEGLVRGNRPPALAAQTIDGKEFQLRSLAGERPAIVYFMATWCPYCAEDFRALSPLYPRYAEEVPLFIMSLDLGEDATLLAEYQARYPGLGEADFAVGVEQVLKDFSVIRTTTKYAIGRDGRILYAGSGPLSTEQWTTLLDALTAS